MSEQSRIPGWLRDAAGAPPEMGAAVPEKLTTVWRIVTWLRKWWPTRNGGV